MRRRRRAAGEKKIKIEVLILLGLTRTASEPKRDEPVELRQRDLQSQGERDISSFTDRNTVNKGHNILIIGYH